MVNMQSAGVKVHIEAKDAEQAADALARALLLQVRETGGNREGTYSVSAKLLADGSYRWGWNWYPPSTVSGERAGSRADDGEAGTAP